MCRSKAVELRTLESAICRGARSLAIVVLVAGCAQKMSNQPRYEPLEASEFFADDRSSRGLVPGTVARGHLQTDARFFTGKEDDKPVAHLPERALEGRSLEELLQRGEDRFNIFCAPCHDRVGTGRGMVVRRGFPQPPSYHIDRLRQAPIGHFFDIATNGFGRMPPYRSQVPTEDRWAIAAYVRALQLSQHAAVSELPEEDRRELQKRAE